MTEQNILLPDTELLAQLEELEQGLLRRTRRRVSSPCGPSIMVDGKSLLAFASNDYLGLANHPELISAAQEGAALWGVGAGASHLVSGHYDIHEQLEARLAQFVQYEAAVTFSTGYMANIAVMPALLSRHDAVFADKLNHASLVDGALLTRAQLHRYPHKDLAALTSLLEKSRAKRKLIVTDSVFSMDGDIAPLAELLELAEQHNAWLLVDDAHGFGILGPQGRGALAAAGLHSKRIILMATLGKAAGVSGAFVAASRIVIDWIIQAARPYIFTTAPAPLLAHTLLKSIDLIERGDKLREQLFGRVARLKASLHTGRWTLLPSDTAVQALVIGSNADTLDLAAALWERGIWTPAIRPPTVPPGAARLRISLTAAHSEAQVDQLVAQLNELQQSNIL